MVKLVTRLSGVPGVSVSIQEELAPHTTLRIGGPAELLVRIQNDSALKRVLTTVRQESIPFRILGLGSNVLIPDEGLVGVVAILEGEFLDWSFHEELAEAGAGLPLARLSRAAAERGLSGLEALAGFPSTVGGAVVMNAGCYGVEIKDVLESATVIQPDGTVETLTPEDLQASYRSTTLLSSSAIVVRASFRLREGDPDELLGRLRELNQKRRESMPSGRPNAGSVFKNPPGDHAGRLIDGCGLKGTRRGGAEISDEHANVIVNSGGATATDVLDLMVEMRRAVELRSRVLLEPELILTGSLRSDWKSRVGDHAES